MTKIIIVGKTNTGIFYADNNLSMEASKDHLRINGNFFTMENAGEMECLIIKNVILGQSTYISVLPNDEDNESYVGVSFDKNEFLDILR